LIYLTAVVLLFLFALIFQFDVNVYGKYNKPVARNDFIIIKRDFFLSISFQTFNN